MQSLKYLCSIVLISTLISCSSTKDIYLSETVEKNSVSSAFYVLPLKNNWLVQGASSNISSNQQALFLTSLEISLRNLTPVRYEIVELKKEYEKGSFNLTKIQSSSSKDSLYTYIPSDEVFSEIDERYIYVFEDYTLGNVFRQAPGSSYAGHETNSGSDYLIFSSKFYLWDKKKNKAIQWGTVKSEVNIGSGDENLDDYIALTSKFMDQILSNSPFVIR